ncbi:Bacteriophage/Gene transfer agent portal protein [uncultured Caudovirales phage]|uniref:Bacteriophage/Gene transfer agent portal protein n=1 Tax=uncultured Caudovirales phage TaxID=2100421 RepID=A0A6J5LTB9_9CAUD|nr:Bacteriophage/Gene transfer agent portal protein [uncultured Caudovirales phage]CAB4152170.1 Bacteriophage/Gene transfer agent portal protein [uncultured Caudovirales phage]
MIVKSISLFGRELFRVERNRAGQFSYTFLDGSSFVDNGKYMELYLCNPVLSTIVNFASNYYSQMKITHVDKNDKVIENSPYTKLLYNPNYFQSKEDFLFQQNVFLSVTGNDYIYQVKAFSNDVPKAIYNLIPNEIDFNNTHKIKKFLVTDKDKKAFEEKQIIYSLDGETFNLPIKSIIPTYDLTNGLVNNSFMQSQSRVKAIAPILYNINKNIESKGINLEMSKKYIGVNSGDGNEAQLQTDDKNSIERSLGSKNVLLTNRSTIDFKHLVSNMKQLYLDEQYSADFNTCLLAFGMNKNVINPFSKDSTFENQMQGLISYIQNSLQNTADNTMNSLSQSWGLFERGEKLKASYDHLPVMQSVINSKIATLTEFQNMVKIAKENGTMTDAESQQKTKELMIKLNL